MPGLGGWLVGWYIIIKVLLSDGFSQELYCVLEQDRAKLKIAKDAAEQITQELKKEGELHKIFEQQLSLSGDEERAHQVGVQWMCLRLGRVAGSAGASSHRSLL